LAPGLGDGTAIERIGSHDPVQLPLRQYSKLWLIQQSRRLQQADTVGGEVRINPDPPVRRRGFTLWFHEPAIPKLANAAIAARVLARVQAEGDRAERGASRHLNQVLAMNL